MNRSRETLAILLVLILAAVGSAYGLRNHPLRLFLLSGGGKPEAFRLQLTLGSGGSQMDSIPLNRAQSKKAMEILAAQDLVSLRSFAKDLGSFGSVIGLAGSNEEEATSWYLGGGWGSALKTRPEGSFDDLGWGDQIYLSLCAKPSTMPPVATGGIEVDDLSGTEPGSSPAPSSTPKAPVPTSQTGPLRVEIQNGCGIKGAADWVARRMKGPDLVIVGTGNADNFHHPKTVIKTTAGVPVVLEEAMERLGLSKDSAEEVETLSGTALGSTLQVSPVDLVVIIGRDFRELKKKAKK